MKFNRINNQSNFFFEKKNYIFPNIKSNPSLLLIITTANHYKNKKENNNNSIYIIV